MNNICNHTKSIDELKDLHNQYFELGHFNSDINTQFALISLVGFLTHLAKKKNADITSYSVIKQIIKNDIPDSFCRSLSIICDDFSYGCSQFPTFGIESKQIPTKIREILLSWSPF